MKTFIAGLCLFSMSSAFALCSFTGSETLSSTGEVVARGQTPVVLATGSLDVQLMGGEIVVYSAMDNVFLVGFANCNPSEVEEGFDCYALQSIGNSTRAYMSTPSASVLRLEKNGQMGIISRDTYSCR